MLHRAAEIWAPEFRSSLHLVSIVRCKYICRHGDNLRLLLGLLTEDLTVESLSVAQG